MVKQALHQDFLFKPSDLVLCREVRSCAARLLAGDRLRRLQGLNRPQQRCVCQTCSGLWFAVQMVMKIET